MAERLFSEFLAEHADGSTDLTLTKDLKEALTAATARNRKAEITLKVTLTPRKGVTEIALASASKLPAEEPDAYLYYNDDGFPVANNPRQMELPLRRLEETRSE